MYKLYIYFMPDPLKTAQFRDRLGPYLDEVVHQHRPLAIDRGGRALVLLVGGGEMLALLGDVRFSPEVFGAGGAVEIWLPELEIYGQGANYDAAKADLIEEVRRYVDEYLANPSYRQATNRAGHLPFVLRAYMAAFHGELDELIFPPAPSVEEIAERRGRTSQPA